MSELSFHVDGVQYKAIEENCHSSCDGCCANDDYYLCHELLKYSYQCNGIIWIRAENEPTASANTYKETEMTKEQQKEIKPKTKHVHADLMLEYAKEAMQSDTPWDAFEYKEKEDTEWQPCNMQIAWFKSTEYRKKPKTININVYEVPEPLREAPANGTACYYPNTVSVLVSCTGYENDSIDRLRLEKGLLHLSRGAAKKHLEALLSFTSDK